MAHKQIAIVALCLIGAVLINGQLKKEEIIKMMMDTATACQAEVGATPSDLQELTAKKPASTYAGKCMRACVMKKFNVMDAQGKFLNEVALEHAKKYTGNDPEKMKIATEIGNACKDIVVPTDHCEAAAEYCQCFREQALAHNLDKFDF